MGKPKAPKPSDPRAVAGAQTATNIGTAIANQNLANVNQVTPFGDLTYSQTGSHSYVDPNTGRTHDIPTYTATQSLAPEQQAILDQNNATQLNLAELGNSQSARLEGILNQQIDPATLTERSDIAGLNIPELEGIGDAGTLTRTYGTDFSDERQRVEDTLLARMQPGLDRDREALEARLAAQGIQAGSEAFNDAFRTHGQQTNDARMAAILGAGQEHSRLVGLEAQRAGFENQAQGMAFSQAATRAQQDNANQRNTFNAALAKSSAQNNQRGSELAEQFELQNQPINRLTALMSGAQVRNPNFVNTPTAQVAGTDVAGAYANHDAAQQNTYAQKMSQWNGIFGGLGGLGGAAIIGFGG